jgi:hypothetical protein
MVTNKRAELCSVLAEYAHFGTLSIFSGIMSNLIMIFKILRLKYISLQTLMQSLFLASKKRKLLKKKASEVIF